MAGIVKPQKVCRVCVNISSCDYIRLLRYCHPVCYYSFVEYDSLLNDMYMFCYCWSCKNVDYEMLLIVELKLIYLD